MNKNIAIAIIILVVVIGGIVFFVSRPKPTEIITPPSGGVAAPGSPLPNVSPLELPPRTENTIQITGTVTRVGSNQLTVDVQTAPPVPRPTPDQIKTTTYQVRITDQTIIRAIVIVGANSGEQRLKLSDIKENMQVTVVGLKQGETGIEAQAIQTTIRQ
jgi:hypothetical protein